MCLLLAYTKQKLAFSLIVTHPSWRLQEVKRCVVVDAFYINMTSMRRPQLPPFKGLFVYHLQQCVKKKEQRGYLGPF